MKSVIIVVLAVVAIIGGAVLLGGSDEASEATASNNFYGQEEGVITFTEYADFECPGCASFAPIIDQVKEDFKDQVRFEFRHFPLVQIHGNATAAHRAAQAAANQGKFWEMHDLLFIRQASWNTQSGVTNPASVFEEYARELGLDIEKYNADAASSETLSTINADVDLGKQLGVASTPSFFLDGAAVDDIASISTIENLTEFLQTAIDAKNGVGPQSSNATGAEDSSEQSTEPESTEPEEEITE